MYTIENILKEEQNNKTNKIFIKNLDSINILLNDFNKLKDIIATQKLTLERDGDLDDITKFEIEKEEYSLHITINLLNYYKSIIEKQCKISENYK